MDVYFKSDVGVLNWKLLCTSTYLHYLVNWICFWVRVNRVPGAIGFCEMFQGKVSSGRNDIGRSKRVSVNEPAAQSTIGTFLISLNNCVSIRETRQQFRIGMRELLRVILYILRIRKRYCWISNFWNCDVSKLRDYLLFYFINVRFVDANVQFHCNFS